jgi:hypothetical protein
VVVGAAVVTGLQPPPLLLLLLLLLEEPPHLPPFLPLALDFLPLEAATATSDQFHFFEGQNAHDDLQLRTCSEGLRHCSLFGFESLSAVTP